MATEPSAATQDEEAIPAALNLPFGQLFFGYPVVPIRPKEEREGTGTAGNASVSWPILYFIILEVVAFGVGTVYNPLPSFRYIYSHNSSSPLPFGLHPSRKPPLRAKARCCAHPAPLPPALRGRRHPLPGRPPTRSPRAQPMAGGEVEPFKGKGDGHEVWARR